MQYFYDGQIRRYLLQIIRLLSNFVVRYGDGTLVRVPVMYGDPDRQVAHIINQNSENTTVSAPRIAVYVTELELDTSRLADPSFVGKMHIREREYDSIAGEYTSSQGDTYTIERLMPTPFKLSVKVDIWSTSNDQKLQILEQILMLFNPSLEIQTTDNYIDWTSLSVVDLTAVTYSSRAVPVGTATEIDIATLTLQTPIYISPPAKVKRLGVVTSIVTSVLGSIDQVSDFYVEGLGSDNNKSESGIVISSPLFDMKTNLLFTLEVTSNQLRLISKNEYISWYKIIEMNPDVYKEGLTKIYLRQPDGTYVIGYVALNPLDDTIMTVNWDSDSYPSNSSIPSTYRNSSLLGSFDAIIDPQKTRPDTTTVGTRYLILEGIGGGYRDTFTAENSVHKIATDFLRRKVNDHKIFVDGVEVGSGGPSEPWNPANPAIYNSNYYITLDNTAPAGSVITYELYMNDDGPDAWKNTDGSDFIAEANDIVEWNGSKWNVIFSASESSDIMIYLTNLYTGTQYKWNGVYWSKSFEGEYGKGDWRLGI